jgi:hypothetical protein
MKTSLFLNSSRAVHAGDQAFVKDLPGGPARGDRPVDKVLHLGLPTGQQASCRTSSMASSSDESFFTPASRKPAAPIPRPGRRPFPGKTGPPAAILYQDNQAKSMKHPAQMIEDASKARS